MIEKVITDKLAFKSHGNSGSIIVHENQGRNP